MSEEATRSPGFDAVVDPAAYVASDVAPAVEALSGKVGAYVFISTGSVYKGSDALPWYEDLPRVTDLASAGGGKVVLPRDRAGPSTFPRA